MLIIFKKYFLIILIVVGIELLLSYIYNFDQKSQDYLFYVLDMNILLLYNIITTFYAYKLNVYTFFLNLF